MNVNRGAIRKIDYTRLQVAYRFDWKEIDMQLSSQTQRHLWMLIAIMTHVDNDCRVHWWGKDWNACQCMTKFILMLMLSGIALESNCRLFKFWTIVSGAPPSARAAYRVQVSEACVITRRGICVGAHKVVLGAPGEGGLEGARSPRSPQAARWRAAKGPHPVHSTRSQ